MRSVKKFLDYGTNVQYQRMHREALIYQLINMYDTGHVDSEGVESDKMTLGAKRRLRNKIFFTAKSMVDADVKNGGNMSVNDVDVIVSAFKTSVSSLSNFKSKLDEIESDWAVDSDTRREVLAAIGSWEGRPYVLASPCDPYFVKSDAFSDYLDGFGYVPIDTNNMDSAEMTDVIISNNLVVESYDQSEIDTEVYTHTVLDGPEITSGFADISHYIKSADVDAVRNFLLSQNVRSVTAKERDFMRNVCEMMSENGYDFTIVPESKTQLRLKMSGGTEIRLLDLEQPQYNGRIYDNGIIGHLTLSKSNGVDVNSIISNEDRIKALRWYFGINDGNPILVSESEQSGRLQIRKTLKVGEQAIHTNGVKRGKGMTSVSAATGRSDNNSVLLRAIDIDPRVNNTTTTNAVKLVMTSAVTTSHDSDEMLFRKSFGNITPAAMTNNVSEGDWAKLKEQIVSEYPEYMPVSDRETVIGDNGESKIVLKDFVDSENFGYYQKLPVYLSLKTWVESSKVRHEELMSFGDSVDDNIDVSTLSLEEQTAYYSTKFSKLLSDADRYEFDNNYYPETTGDDDIDELRSLYWKMLTKQIKRDALLEYMRADDAFDLDTATNSQLAILIDRHYSDYLQREFGTLPDLQVPGESIVDNTGKGFNPEKVAKYTTASGSLGVQKNYDYIRHMLSRLDGVYESNWIIGDTYIGNQIKNDLIRYDESSVQGTFRLSSILNEYNNTRNDAVERIMSNNPELANKPVTVEMMIHIGETLLTSGFDKDSIVLSVDDNGIVKYSGRQMNIVELDKTDIDSNRKYTGSKFVDKTGYVGQIFEPDKYGVIDPKYVVDTGSVFVPGYQVYLSQNDPENPEDLMTRIRGVGWKKLMRQQISKELRRGSFQIAGEYEFIPRCAALNEVYRKAYDTVLERTDYLDHIITHEEQPTAETLTYINVLRDLSGRCRFSNDVGEGASTMTQSMLEHPDRQEAQQYDYFYSDLYENKNIRVLDSSFDGLFDPNATGTAKTQGVVRYLAVGANFDARTGRPIPVEFGPNDPVPECALMQDELMRNKNHNTWDRRLMAFSQILTAWHTPRDVGVAMMNIKGLTFDDGFVVSKKFAERYAVKNARGEVRPLVAQDKLSDMHGNKGVISLVVDPDLMSDNIARVLNDEYDFDGLGNSSGVMTVTFNDKDYHIPFDTSLSDSVPMQAAYFIQKELGVYGFDDVMQVFRDNDELDVVMAPYSGMSRFNGGSMVTMLEDSEKSKDLVVNGQVIHGGIGYTDLIVVDMLADVKTHFYTEDAVREGKGRKASGQLAWALQSKGANMIMKEFYGDNAKAFDDLREYSLAIGLDWNEKFEPVIGYHPQTSRGEKRKLICLPDVNAADVLKSNKKSLDKGELLFNDDAYRELSAKIMQELNENGGFMELPFQLDFKTADGVSGVIGRNYIPENAFLLQETGHTYTYVDENGKSVTRPTYGLPVLSHSLRSNQEFQDNTSRISEYTRRYVDIYMAGVMYKAVQEYVRDCKLELDACDKSAEPKKYENLKRKYDVVSNSELLQKIANKAQDSLDKITTEIRERRFDSKYNVIREELMSKRLANSATAVWSADPRLKSDEVAMSFSNAVALGLTNKFSAEDIRNENRKFDTSLEQTYREYVDENGEVQFERVSDLGQIMEGDIIHQLKPNPYVLVWRDPVLHDGNVRYMRVIIDNRIMGCSINPLMDASFDGDFDGDSVALVALQTDEANKQAYTAFSFETNLLNLGVKQKFVNPLNPDEIVIGHPLYIQKGLDTAALMYVNPELKSERAQIEFDINKFEMMVRQLKSGEITEKDFTDVYQSFRRDKDSGKLVLKDAKFIINDKRREFKNRIDGWMEKSLDGIGEDIVRVDTPEHLIESLQHIVDDGAKGNQSKMHDLCENIGITYDIDESGRAIPSTAKKVVDSNGNWVSVNTLNGVQRDVDNAIQETAAYKADNTQLGGTAAQKGVAAFRDVDIHAALEITYPVTQAILQSKHDPKDAKIKDEIVRFWGNDCWNGYKLSGNWSDSVSVEELQNTPHVRETRPVVDPKTGNPIPVTYYDSETKSVVEKKDKYGHTVYEKEYVKCSRDEWVQQMKGMMRALKVDDSINPDYIENLADAMVQGSGYAQAISVETGRPITFRDGGSSRVVRSGKNDTVLGVSDYIKQKGTLLDQMGYVGKFGACLNKALMSCDGYIANIKEKSQEYLLESRESGHDASMSVIGNAVAESIAIKKTEEAIVDAKVEAVEASKDDKIVKKAAVKTAEAAHRDAMSNLSKSGMFVPQNVISELYGDVKRTARIDDFTGRINVSTVDAQGNRKSLDQLTADVTSHITSSDTYSDEEKSEMLRSWNNEVVVNESVAYKGKKRVTVKSAPRPVGRKDCLLSVDAYEDGVAYMCESQSSYELRQAKAKQKMAEFEVTSDIDLTAARVQKAEYEVGVISNDSELSVDALSK